MIKFLRHIRQKLFANNHFGKYLLHALGILSVSLFLTMTSCQEGSTAMDEQLITEEANKNLIKKLLADGDENNWGAVEKALSTNYRYYAPSNAAPIDASTHLSIWKGFYDAIPDLVHTIKAIYSEGDIVIARLIVKGQHTKELMGVAPTGKVLEISETLIFRIIDGKISEFWNDSDNLGLLQQIGYNISPPE